MVEFSEIFSNIKDSIMNHRKQTLIVSGTLVFMTFAALIVLLISEMAKENNEPKEDFYTELQLSDPLLIPSETIDSEKYIKSRKTQKNWTKEDAEKWFTFPSSSDLKKLSASNDKKINEILGATP